MKNFYIALAFVLGAAVFALAANEKKDAETQIADKRDVHDFSKVSFMGNGNLYVQQGDHELVQIIAQESLIPYIYTEVSKGTLTIGEKPLGWLLSLKSFEPYDVYITVKEIEEITLTGKGKLTSKDVIKGNRLALNVSGSGTVDFAVDVEKLISNIAGTANYHLKGNASEQEIRISGTGTYQGFKLLGDRADIDIRGFGNVQVNIQDSLDVSISGKGDVTYMGQPKITQKIRGIGKVEELK